MKISILISMMFGVVLALAGPSGRAAEDTNAIKLKRIEEEVARRRKEHAYALENHGVAFTPVSVLESWYNEEMDLQIEDCPIGDCCQTFATLSRREVLASCRVVKKHISISAGRVDGAAALIAFRRAIEAQGVAIIPVGDRILVLVDAVEIANDKKG